MFDGKFPRLSPRVRACACVVLAISLLVAATSPQAARSQSAPSFDTDDIKRGREILKMIKSEVEERYYDKSFHGVDIQTRFKEADEMIKKADSNGQIFGIIAHTLLFLNDSHTYFVPPGRVAHIDYGWQVQLIGDKCYLVSVKPGSDAERKGLKAGDTVHFIGGMKPTKADLWKIQYLYAVLRPQTHVVLTVQSPDGQPRDVDVLSKIFQPGKDDIWTILFGGKYSTEEEDNPADDADDDGETKPDEKKDEKKKDKDKEKERERNATALAQQRFQEISSDTCVWKMPRFNLDKDELDEMMVKRAAKYQTLILDLRGNPGGYIKTLVRLVSYFFEREVKIADLMRRKEKKELVAKPLGAKFFKGRLVVLIDSNSGSAAELFARVMQLEKRATVIGDHSAGAVMVGRRGLIPIFEERPAYVKGTFFSLSVTHADALMTDGQSLEHTGVTPDELILPAAADLAARRDPVLARAAALAGVNLAPDKAGALFPVEGRK